MAPYTPFDYSSRTSPSSLSLGTTLEGAQTHDDSLATSVLSAFTVGAVIAGQGNDVLELTNISGVSLRDLAFENFIRGIVSGGVGEWGATYSYLKNVFFRDGADYAMKLYNLHYLSEFIDIRVEYDEIRWCLLSSFGMFRVPNS